MKDTLEQVQGDWERLMYIKKFLYGLGTPPESAVEFYEDKRRIEKRLKKLGEQKQ